MKKISILFSTLALGITTQAQQVNASGPKVPYSPKRVTPAELVVSQQHATPAGENRGTGFFFEDFANGFAGNNSFGAWTYEDSGNNTIWMEADANSPGGEFSATDEALASPGAANGWVIFDADLYNTPVSNGVEDVTGWLQTPELDCSALNSVIVEYNQVFRYCCFSPSPLTLEVSSDGGSTWTVYPAHGSFTQSANTLSANPLNTKVDISCAAAGESSVLIRWGYNTIGETGYSHYHWGLDDISIYENTVADDLEITQVTNGDIFNIWEYRVTPLEQRILSADGGLLAGVIYRNNGFNNQTNVVLTVDILDSDGNILSTTDTDPFDMESFANTPECPSFLLDTLYIETGWEPTAIGNYTVRASITSDGMDENPADNILDREIEYTVDEYGHDDFDALDLEISPRESEDTPNLFEPTGYGNFFSVPNEGSSAHGLTVVFGPDCAVGADFTAILFMGSPNDGDVQTSEDYYTTEGQLNDMPHYYAFDEPTDLLVGESYFCAVLNEDETTKPLTVAAQSNSDTDNSTGVFEKGGSGDFVWFFSQNWSPAVRMILSSRVGVDEMNSKLQSFSLYPNPAVNIVKVQFELNSPGVIAYEVRDMSGKLVETKSNIGRFQAGNNTFDLNVSNYPSGNYTVSLVIDGQNLFSRQLNVTK